MSKHPALKRNRSSSSELSPPPESPTLLPKTKLAADSESPHKSKKLKLLATYSSSSPFPDFPHPTAEEAREIHDLISQGERKAPSDSNNSGGTCGATPDVIDSLIGTILSQNTSNKNSSSAKRSLDETFGKYNWPAIATAERDDIVEAIRHGGLANRKAAIIQNLLRSIHGKHGEYSLQHLADPLDGKTAAEADENAMSELVSYDGVGPKTAACVLMFCLGREAFAVDTHVFRLSKMIGWVPKTADRVMAQAHLDVKIPGELKWGLHTGMVRHGRMCKGCRSTVKQQDYQGCVLRQWVREKRGVQEDEERFEELKTIDGEVGDDEAKYPIKPKNRGHSHRTKTKVDEMEVMEAVIKRSAPKSANKKR